MISKFLTPLKDTMRWGVWAPVAIMLGVMIYFWLNVEPPFCVVYFAGGAAAFLLLLAAFGLRRFPFYYIVCLGLMWVLLGFTAGVVRTSLVAHKVLAQAIEQPVMAHGVVEIVEDVAHSGKRILLSDVDLWKIPPAEIPQRIRIVSRSHNMPEIEPGDRIAVRVKLSPPPRPVFPHGYDFARMTYFVDRFGAVGFAISTPYIIEKHEEKNSLQHINRLIERHRYHLTERIYNALETNYVPSVVGITAAMITSEVGRISQTDLVSLRASGLAHILSISGLHMVLAGSILFVGVRMLLALFPFIVLHYPIKKWAAAAAIIASFYYLLIAGMPVPAERSYLMLCLFFIAVILDRTNTPMRPIALAAGFLMLLKPESILDPSFQMSFAAVIALCAYFQDPPEVHPYHRNLIYQSGKHLWSVAMASVIAGGATAPFAFYHFGQYAVYGLFANMLVVPLTSFVIMPAGVVALLMMPFGLEHWPLAFMAEGIRGMMWVSDRVTALPFSTLNLPHMGLVPLILMVFGGLWVCLWVKQVRWLGLAPIAVGIIIYANQQLPNVVLDERGKLFAIHDPEVGMLVPARTYARYARQYWAKALGVEKMVRFDELPTTHPLYDCDETECSWQNEGLHFYRGEKCEAADVLILTEDLTCKGNLLTITPKDLAENGTYAIWAHAGKLRVESVEKPRGHRGWTMQ